MDKKKTLKILKSVAIISVIVLIAFLLRANAANLSVIPDDQREYFIDADGLPYFSEMDSYYGLRLTENFIENGHVGVTMQDGVPWDTLRNSPHGWAVEYELMIVYVTALLYHIANVFMDVSVREVAFYTAAIIAPFAAIPAYVFVRRITNDYGAITAAVLASLAPSYFGHTFAGFFDTDMFQVIFPILIILFFLESIRSDKLKYRILFALLSLTSILLFSISWIGYTFSVAVLVIFVVVYLIASFLLKTNIIKPFKDYPNKLEWFINQRAIFSLSLIAIVGFIVVTVTGNLEKILSDFVALTQQTQIQALAQTSAYPNVLISVGELQSVALVNGGLVGAFLSSSGAAINAIGGILSFFGILIILFLFAQRLYNLQSIRTRKHDKKPPKNQRKNGSRSNNDKKDKSFIESTLGNVSTRDLITESKNETILYLSLFVVWLGLTAFAISQGSRFLLAFAVPASLATGIFVGYAATYIKNKIDDDKILLVISAIGALLIVFPVQMFGYMIQGLLPYVIIILAAIIIYYGSKKINIKKISKFSKIKKTIVIMIVTLAFIAPTITGAYYTSVNTVPGTSDPMWDSMLWIRENTTNDTVVASWWDFGYLFQIASHRQVIFDGGEKGARVYWVGKAMTTTDMELSAGIFEMLATTGDEAFIRLDRITNNTTKTVEILEKTLPVSKEEAKTIMTGEYKLSSAQADEILRYSHPDNPRPVIFVASSDLIQKAIWWTYFGNWDFEAQNSQGYSYFASEVPEKMKNLSGGRQQAIVTNFVLGPGTVNAVNYQTIITKGPDNVTNVSFEARLPNGSVAKQQNGSVFIPLNPNKDYEEMKIYRVFMVEDGYLTKNDTVDENGKYVMFVFGNNGTYFSIVMSKELENSMFTKLYILGGYGQDTYEIVNSEPGVSLWKIKR